MAPIKFEEQLKEKLEKRSLQPSKDSWAKLSERLDAEDKKSRKPWFTWMSIAAGIIILLSILIQTFGSETDQEVIPQIVEEDTIENTLEEQLPISNENKAIELVAEEQAEDVNATPDKTDNQSKLVQPKSKPENASKIRLADQTNDKSESKDVIKEPKELSKELIKDAQINKEAVAQALQNLDAEKSNVTDREVDSLLKLASKALVKDKLLKESSKTVNAQSLLEEVEDEMGQSFRSKVYEALKDGYKTVKTAVAQRNN